MASKYRSWGWCYMKLQCDPTVVAKPLPWLDLIWTCKSSLESSDFGFEVNRLLYSWKHLWLCWFVLLSAQQKQMYHEVIGSLIKSYTSNSHYTHEVHSDLILIVWRDPLIYQNTSKHVWCRGQIRDGLISNTPKAPLRLFASLRCCGHSRRASAGWSDHWGNACIASWDAAFNKLLSLPKARATKPHKTCTLHSSALQVKQVTLRCLDCNHSDDTVFTHHHPKLVRPMVPNIDHENGLC